MYPLKLNSETPDFIDKETFENLFLSHCEALCISVYKIVGDAHIAEDIVQDFFYIFWKSHRNKQFSHSFLSYAQKSVRNRAFDYLNQKKKANSVVKLVDDGAMMMDDAEENKRLAEQQEYLYERMEKELGNLPDGRRKIFLLSNSNNLTYKQIAEKLNISVNTVKTQIKLAYRQLRTNS